MIENFFHYRGLCQSLVRRFLRAGIEREDLEQVAALGLTKACHRFRADRGVTFTTYAWSAICGELLHYVRDHARTVRLPRAVWETAAAERAASERLAHAYGREASSHEIAAALDVPIETIALLREGGVAQVPLRESDIRITDSCEDLIVLRDALNVLPADERAMLVGVYVLGFAQSEVGARLGYPQRRASRLHARAIRHLADVLGDVYA